MTINSLKELDKLIALCRKRGVDSIKIDNIEFKLSEVVGKTSRSSNQVFIPQETYSPGGINENTKIDTPDELSPDQLLFYSAGAISETM